MNLPIAEIMDKMPVPQEVFVSLVVCTLATFVGARIHWGLGVLAFFVSSCFLPAMAIMFEAVTEQETRGAVLNESGLGYFRLSLLAPLFPLAGFVLGVVMRRSARHRVTMLPVRDKVE